MAASRGPRKRPRSPKEIRKIREDEQTHRDATPSDRQRKVIIQLGVGVLLLAFLTTSGITFVNLNSASRQPEATSTDTPRETEMDRWRKEAKEKPNDPAALANLAYYLIGEAQSSTNVTAVNSSYAEADANLQAALKIDKEYPFALRLLGQLNLARNNPGEAAKYFQQGLAAASKPIDAADKEKESKEQNQRSEQVEDRVGLAAVSMVQKKPAESLKELDQALKVDSGAPRIYQMRSRIYLEQGQKELARKDLETLLKIAQATNNAQAGQYAMVMLQALEPTPTATPGKAASGTPAPILPPPVSIPTALPSPQAAASGTPGAAAPTATPSPRPTP